MLTRSYFWLCLALIFAFFASTLAQAQIVLNEDFGSGSNPGAALPSGITTYTYNGTASGLYPDIVDDGEYTVGTNTQLASQTWADIPDHTSNNGSGYMMIINATEGLTDEFFRKTVSLSANTTYEFIAFLINANSQSDYDYCTNNQGGLILPNVKFTIETVGGTELASTASGEIPFNPTPIWGEYKLNFTTNPSTANVQLVLSNLAPGGCGNDIALDDISFRVQVTMTATNDSAIVADATSGATNIINVMDNDLMDGNAISTFVLSLASGSTLPSALAFDLATGNISVVAGAATGVYTFNYQICETAQAYNCDTANVSIDVTTPVSTGGGGGAGSGTCPIGQVSTAQTGYALTAILHDGAPQDNAEGEPAPESTNDTGGFSNATYYSYIQLDLTGTNTQTIPAGADITLSLTSAWGTGGRAEILSSVDGSNFTSLGTIGNGGTIAGTWSSNILRRDTVTVPSGGARYIRINEQADGIRVDGAIYTDICATPPPTPQLNVLKINTIYDPNAEGLYAIPGNDVIYTITVSNSGNGTVDAGTMFLADALPTEVSFYNGDMDDGGALTNDPVAWSETGTSMSLLYGADVGYSNGMSPPTSFLDCNYSPVSGYDSNVHFVCFNPQGSMPAANTSPDPEWAVSFRVKIN